MIKIPLHLAYVATLVRLANTLLKDEESARNNHVLACNFAKYSPVLEYAATLPCNLSLRARFADINVSQGSAATYARCSGTFNIHLTANLPRNLPAKFSNRLRFDRIMVMSLWSRIFGAPSGLVAACVR